MELKRISRVVVFKERILVDQGRQFLEEEIRFAYKGQDVESAIHYARQQLRNPDRWYVHEVLAEGE